VSCPSILIISASPSSSEDRWRSTTGSGARVRKVNRRLTCATTRSYTCKFAERRPPLQIHPPPPRTPSLPISLPPRGTGWIARNFRRGEAQEKLWVEELGGGRIHGQGGGSALARGTGRRRSHGLAGRASVPTPIWERSRGMGERDCANLGRRSTCLLAASSQHYCR